MINLGFFLRFFVNRAPNPEVRWLYGWRASTVCPWDPGAIWLNPKPSNCIAALPKVHEFNGDVYTASLLFMWMGQAGWLAGWHDRWGSFGSLSAVACRQYRVIYGRTDVLGWVARNAARRPQWTRPRPYRDAAGTRHRSEDSSMIRPVQQYIRPDWSRGVTWPRPLSGEISPLDQSGRILLNRPNPTTEELWFGACCPTFVDCQAKYENFMSSLPDRVGDGVMIVGCPVCPIRYCYHDISWTAWTVLIKLTGKYSLAHSAWTDWILEVKGQGLGVMWVWVVSPSVISDRGPIYKISYDKLRMNLRKT